MTVFGEITILVVIAVLVSVIMHFLKQPLIIGHIFTGLLVGPMVFNLVKSEETLTVFSEIGIAFLLFIVGLNLTPKIIRQFGKVAVLTGVGQMLFTVGLGFSLALLLGFSPITAAYLGAALAMSSTIIILKLLSDKGDLEKLYGRISVGFLLVQDLIAVALLFLVPLLAIPKGTAGIALTVIKAAATLILLYIVAARILPKLNNFFARSQELLFLFSIAWGLGLASVFRVVGFSLETGALIAGVALSALPSHQEIHSRLKPLRDFFVVIFFILLGAKIVPFEIAAMMVPAVILSLFILVGNPLIMMTIMGFMGYRKKTGFQTGLVVAQISEFSLILIALGIKLGHIPSSILPLVTLVGLATIFGCTYLVIHSESLYRALAPALKIFERRPAREQAPAEHIYEFLLFGYNRIGYDFISVFKKAKASFLVVDYNPETIEYLDQIRAPNLYGDASDIEFLRLLDFKKAKIVVSTVPDLPTNLLILEEVKRHRSRAIVMAVSHNISDALRLYSKGIHYVIMPHFLGGKHASLLVQDLGFDAKSFQRLRQKHLRHLKHRLAAGHEHPINEKIKL